MASPNTIPADLSAAMITAPTHLADWLVVAPVAVCITFGAVLMMLRKQTWLQAGAAVIGFALLVLLGLALLVHVGLNGTVTMTMGRWLPPFGISFTVDLLGASLTLVAAIVALATAIYGADDVDGSGRRYGFYPFLFLMMAGVSGAFLTGDIFNLYVWFEVLLISSFGLLILGSQPRQIDGATKYAFLNLVATTLFLITTGYLYGVFGTLNMADIMQKAPDLSGRAPLVTITALYFMAFGMKAAAFPVNFWLPASYHTPRIVVSALFAGLLTKVGVYALLRVLIMLFPAERGLLGSVIAAVAVLTMVLGALGAIAQTDYRRLLGYLVISGIGVMIAGIALASITGLSGTIFYAVHSMIVMTALYLACGLTARVAGGFSLADTGGVYRSHLFLSALSLMLLLAVSGLPPFSGFWPKAVLVKASLDVGEWWVAGAILLTGFLTTIAAGRVWILVYWRSAKKEPEPDVAPVRISVLVDYLPLALLTGLAVLLGIYPEPFLDIAQTAASQLIHPAAYIDSVFPTGGTQ